MLAAIAVMGLVGSAMAAEKLIVKDSASATKFAVDDAGFVNVNSSAAHAQLNLTASSDQATGGGQKPMVVFKRSRGTSAAPTAVQLNDSLGQFLMSGATGAGTYDATRRIFEIVATENWSSTAGGYQFGFYTRANGTIGGPQLVATFTQDRKLCMYGGACATGTQWVDFSSREYKENIQDLAAEKAMDTLKNLTPVTYNYKLYPDQARAGFIAEDVPDLVAQKDRKGLTALDIVAVLTKVVQEQNKTIEALSAKVDMIEKAATK